MLGKKAQRMPAAISAVAAISTKLAGSDKAKNLTKRSMKAPVSSMVPVSSRGRTEMASTSSQSISKKVGKTGRKKTKATNSEPSVKAADSHARRWPLTGGRGVCWALSKAPRSCAGEPLQMRAAGTVVPLARADWPSTWPYASTRTLPSTTV